MKTPCVLVFGVSHPLEDGIFELVGNPNLACFCAFQRSAQRPANACHFPAQHAFDRFLLGAALYRPGTLEGPAPPEWLAGRGPEVYKPRGSVRGIIQPDDTPSSKIVNDDEIDWPLPAAMNNAVFPAYSAPAVAVYSAGGRFPSPSLAEDLLVQGFKR